MGTFSYVVASQAGKIDLIGKIDLMEITVVVSVEMKFEEGTLSLTALERSLQDLLIEMEIIFKGKE